MKRSESTEIDGEGNPVTRYTAAASRYATGYTVSANYTGEVSKLRSFLPAMMLCALCVTQASALEYDFDAPEDYLFGQPTSDDTIFEWENSNVDRSKNTALAAPGFGTPTRYLPGSGECLPPNLVPGALSGGLVNQAGSACFAGHNRGTNNYSGKIHNRLLCEFAVRGDFRRLMVDLEIYVDRIASTHIRDTNAMLKAQRKVVMEREGLDDNELNMRTLLAQVDEDDYFAYTIFEDLRPILRDIREAHRADIITADVDTESPAEKAAHQPERALSREGSTEETIVKVLLSQLAIDYDTLTQEEFVTLIGILNKS